MVVALFVRVAPEHEQLETGPSKNREVPTRVGSALWFRVFPWAGLTGWAAPHDDIEPSYRDPHMAKFRESRPSEARPATKTPAGSSSDDRAASRAAGWAGWGQQL